jgi:hypothetical protein
MLHVVLSPVSWRKRQGGKVTATKGGKVTATKSENTESTSRRGKPTIVSSVFHGAEPCIRAPIARPCP